MATLDCDSPQSLFTKTRSLLLADGRTPLELHQATGIPFYWLSSFSKGKIMNPAVNRVQYLYEYLTGTKLIG